MGGDGMDGILAIEGFDTSLAEGVMLLTPFNADDEDEPPSTLSRPTRQVRRDPIQLPLTPMTASTPTSRLWRLRLHPRHERFRAQ